MNGSRDLDLVVIGAGPAGEKAAARAAYFGKRVAIVERAPRPGGSAVSNAGIPTKTLRETALFVTGFRRRDVYGVGLQLDPEEALHHLRARTGQVIETMTGAVERNLERHGIGLVRGEGSLGADRTVIVRHPDGTTTRLEAEVVLIATGSRPHRPSGIPFEDPDVHDSESILAIDRPVRRLVVVGGGPVACEYASIFTALGVETTLVNRGRRLLPFLDGEMSDLIVSIFERLGMRLITGDAAESVVRDAGGLAVRLSGGETLRADKLLYASGRAGNTDGLGLAGAGVEVDDRGRVLVDECFATTAEGVYAAGDVIGSPGLASVSMEQGRVAVSHAFGIRTDDAIDPRPPFGVYSIPEAAMVGLTEEAAAAAGIDYEVGRCAFGRNTRATIAGTTDGMVKLVFARADRRLLGVHIVGDNAAELMHLGQAVLNFQGSIDYFIHTTFNVPTETEAYKYAAYDGLQRLSGRTLDAPLGGQPAPPPAPAIA